MITEPSVKSRYELRVDRVQGIVAEHTELTADASNALAVAILQSIDRIPEVIR